MKEILGYNLLRFFNTVTSHLKEAEVTYYDDRYEVWEVSDELYSKMCDMSEEEFAKLAGEEAWWIYAEGSSMGDPNADFIINEEEMIGWNERGKYENFQYDNLSDYLCYGIGASDETNVCALVVDLAKYNNMTMSELFTKYEG